MKTVGSQTKLLFGVGARLVQIALLIAVGRVRRNRNVALRGRRCLADGISLPDPRIDRVGLRNNFWSDSGAIV